VDEVIEWLKVEITPKNGNWNRVSGAFCVPVNKGNYPNHAI
jgi:hypothetical protein